MTSHPEERRIAGLLRELVVQTGTSLDVLEERLGWQSGQLAALFDGRQRLSFEDVLAILPLVGTTPSDFFAWLYGFDVRQAGLTSGERMQPAADDSPEQRTMDRRFEASLRVVRNAIARRAVWKREQNGGD